MFVGMFLNVEPGDSQAGNLHSDVPFKAAENKKKKKHDECRKVCTDTL